MTSNPWTGTSCAVLASYCLRERGMTAAEFQRFIEKLWDRLGPGGRFAYFMRASCLIVAKRNRNR